MERGHGHGLAGKSGGSGGKGSKNGQKGRSKSPAGPRGICWQWQNCGKCSRGKDCPFDHLAQDSSDGNNNVPQPPSAPNTLRKSSKQRGTSPSGKTDTAFCWNFLKGNCTKGKECDF
eukprot:7374921-Karenia_brevis.AAC.1